MTPTERARIAMHKTNADAAYATVKADLEHAIRVNYNANEIDMPLLDGTQYSPSDRAFSEVEAVYREMYAYDLPDETFYNLLARLDSLYDELGLHWSDGCLYM